VLNLAYVPFHVQIKYRVDERKGAAIHHELALIDQMVRGTVQ
jgi:hypothetical protein